MNTTGTISITLFFGIATVTGIPTEYTIPVLIIVGFITLGWKLIEKFQG